MCCYEKYMEIMVKSDLGLIFIFFDYFGIFGHQMRDLDPARATVIPGSRDGAIRTHRKPSKTHT